MGCLASKHLSQYSVVKLVRMRPPDDVYASVPVKTNIYSGKSIIIKFKDGLL
jgi:hypothetical protein